MGPVATQHACPAPQVVVPQRIPVTPVSGVCASGAASWDETASGVLVTSLETTASEVCVSVAITGAGAQ